MASIFSKIIQGDIPSYKIAENENYFAFLDIQPLVLGHTLVIPKTEVDYIFDLEKDSLSGLFLFSQQIAIALKKVVPCKRIGITVIGLEVPHAHVHLVPMNQANDMNFASPKLKLSAEELQQVAEKIKAAF